MKSRHWREVFRGNNVGFGNQMDFGFDRVGVTMRLLARLGNRKKTGPGEYEQIDACSSAGLKKSGDLVFCKKMPSCIKNYLFSWDRMSHQAALGRTNTGVGGIFRMGRCQYAEAGPRND